jgi:hypothetical protein
VQPADGEPPFNAQQYLIDYYSQDDL